MIFLIMMTMRIDYHIHSKFSSDSTLSLEKLVDTAIKKKYSHIAVTDHFDFLPTEMRIYGVRPYEKYFHLLNKLKSICNPKLNVLVGAEVGEYHRVSEIADKVFETHPPDLKIGSIHVISNGKNVSNPLSEQLTKKEVLDYYNENLNLVSHGNIDILGHLGIFKRYFPNPHDDSFATSLIVEIFRTMIAKNIALEINTSGLRKPLRELIPDPVFIKLYLAQGGRLISLGSDSHRNEDFDVNYNESIDRLINTGINQLAVKTDNNWELIPI